MVRGLMLAAVFAAAVVVAGCKSVLGIRPPVPTIVQGNVYTPQDLAKLAVGMSDSQVLYVLGTPLLRPIYAPNHWYYYSSAVRERNTTLRRLLVLSFEDDRLTGWAERLKNEQFIEDIRLQEHELGKPEDAEEVSEEYELPEDEPITEPPRG